MPQKLGPHSEKTTTKKVPLAGTFLKGYGGEGKVYFGPSEQLKSTSGAERELLEPCPAAHSDKGDKSAQQTWVCLNMALTTASSSL